MFYIHNNQNLMLTICIHLSFLWKSVEAVELNSGELAGLIFGLIFGTILLVAIVSLIGYYLWLRSGQGQRYKNQRNPLDPENPSSRIGLREDPEGKSEKRSHIGNDNWGFDNEGFETGSSLVGGKRRDDMANSKYHDAHGRLNGKRNNPQSLVGYDSQLNGSCPTSDPLDTTTGQGLQGKGAGTVYTSSLEQLAGKRSERVNVPLKSKDFSGLGLSIAGSMQDGIFVRSTVTGGPAQNSGLICPGDRITALRVSYQNMVYEDALTILSYSSPYDVTLTVEPRESILHKNSVHSVSGKSAGSFSGLGGAVAKRGSRSSSSHNADAKFHPLVRSQSVQEFVGSSGGKNKLQSDKKQRIVGESRSKSERHHVPHDSLEGKDGKMTLREVEGNDSRKRTSSNKQASPGVLPLGYKNERSITKIDQDAAERGTANINPDKSIASNKKEGINDIESHPILSIPDVSRGKILESKRNTSEDVTKIDHYPDTPETIVRPFIIDMEDKPTIFETNYGPDVSTDMTDSANYANELANHRNSKLPYTDELNLQRQPATYHDDQTKLIESKISKQHSILPIDTPPRIHNADLELQNTGNGPNRSPNPIVSRDSSSKIGTPHRQSSTIYMKERDYSKYFNILEPPALARPTALKDPTRPFAVDPSTKFGDYRHDPMDGNIRRGLVPKFSEEWLQKQAPRQPNGPVLVNADETTFYEGASKPPNYVKDSREILMFLKPPPLFTEEWQIQMAPRHPSKTPIAHYDPCATYNDGEYQPPPPYWGVKNNEGGKYKDTGSGFLPKIKSSHSGFGHEWFDIMAKNCEPSDILIHEDLCKTYVPRVTANETKNKSKSGKISTNSNFPAATHDSIKSNFFSSLKKTFEPHKHHKQDKEHKVKDSEIQSSKPMTKTIPEENALTDSNFFKQSGQLSDSEANFKLTSEEAYKMNSPIFQATESDDEEKDESVKTGKFSENSPDAETFKSNWFDIYETNQSINIPIQSIEHADETRAYVTVPTVSPIDGSAPVTKEYINKINFKESETDFKELEKIPKDYPPRFLSSGSSFDSGTDVYLLNRETSTVSSVSPITPNNLATTMPTPNKYETDSFEKLSMEDKMEVMKLSYDGDDGAIYNQPATTIYSPQKWDQSEASSAKMTPLKSQIEEEDSMDWKELATKVLHDHPSKRAHEPSVPELYNLGQSVPSYETKPASPEGVVRAIPYIPPSLSDSDRLKEYEPSTGSHTNSDFKTNLEFEPWEFKDDTGRIVTQVENQVIPGVNNYSMPVEEEGIVKRESGPYSFDPIHELGVSSNLIGSTSNVQLDRNNNQPIPGNKMSFLSGSILSSPSSSTNYGRNDQLSSISNLSQPTSFSGNPNATVGKSFQGNLSDIRKSSIDEMATAPVVVPDVTYSHQRSRLKPVVDKSNWLNPYTPDMTADTSSRQLPDDTSDVMVTKYGIDYPGGEIGGEGNVDSRRLVPFTTNTTMSDADAMLHDMNENDSTRLNATRPLSETMTFIQRNIPDSGHSVVRSSTNQIEPFNDMPFINETVTEEPIIRHNAGGGDADEDLFGSVSDRVAQFEQKTVVRELGGLFAAGQTVANNDGQVVLTDTEQNAAKLAYFREQLNKQHDDLAQLGIPVPFKTK